jgi:hypothetical protein
MMTETDTHDRGWLAGFMDAAQRAYALAVNDEQRALAERVLQEAVEAQAEAYADAVLNDD